MSPAAPNGQTNAAAWGTGDLAQPFTIESEHAIRGRIVRLGPALDEILQNHNYPPAVSVLVAEAVVLVTLLGSGMKFDGKLTLQSRGSGPVSIIVADYLSSGEVRGYAGFDAVRVAALGAETGLRALLGDGTLVITVDQGEDTGLYQGIVEFEGDSLASCVQAYLRRSEQVESAVRLAVAPMPADGEVARWRAGGLMIQHLPKAGAPFLNEEDEPFQRSPDDPWHRTQLHLETVEDDELTDGTLDPRRLLYRLFHEEGVRATEPQLLGFGCTCSAGRVRTILQQYPEEEQREMLEDGKIRVRCEFCSRSYNFSIDELKDS